MIIASLIEEAFDPPPGMEGWRAYRIDYCIDFAPLEAVVEGRVFRAPCVTDNEWEGMADFLSGNGRGA